ncbi:MAG: HAMP domain-containing histidine kinase [Candidatus Omnitrophica bacterium]|nr:HAMP domain-containing histidine kinase [Candidatus Omnitrophota bacterium]
MKILKSFLFFNNGFLQSLLLTMVIFYLDYITGAYLGLALLYVGAVVFSTWSGGLSNGMIIAFISAACWLTADLMGGLRYPSILFPLWNAGIRLFIFGLIAYFIWKVETAKKLRKEFLNFVVHDLRNPLFSVVLIGENMRKHPVYAADPDLKEQVEDTLLITKQMTSLVESILDLSALENKAVIIQYSDFEVKNLVQAAVQQVSVFAAKSKIILKTQIAPEISTINTDYNMVSRVLVNLLVNAIKASPQAGTVTVCVEMAGKDNLVFSVADQGAGIPPRIANIIFNQFVTTRARGVGMCRGFGLGLTFCKLAVEKLGGRIYVSTRQEKGAKFSFILSLNPKAKVLHKDQFS